MPDIHQSLKDLLSPFQNAADELAGNEGLLNDVFANMSGGLFSGIKAGGAKAADMMVRGLKNTNQGILKAVGARRLLLSTLASRAKKDGMEENITFSAGYLKRVTRDGEVDDIHGATAALADAVKLVMAYELELEAFYRKQLSLLKSYDRIKTTEDAIKVIEELEELVHPIPNFPVRNNSMFRTKLLPYGREFVFDKEKHTFAIETTEIDATEVSVAYPESEVIKVLLECNRLVDSYNALVKANDRYGKYIADFNTVVGKSYAHLEGLRGSVSATLLSDLEHRLQGDHSTFAFYTNWLTKVILVVDNHVEDHASFFSKHFN